jgi:hypothetical protein
MGWDAVLSAAQHGGAPREYQARWGAPQPYLLPPAVRPACGACSECVFNAGQRPASLTCGERLAASLHGRLCTPLRRPPAHTPPPPPGARLRTPRLRSALTFAALWRRLIGRMPDSAAKAEAFAAIDCAREAAEVMRV